MSPLNVTARAAVFSACSVVREHAATTATIAMTASAPFSPLLRMRWIVGDLATTR